MQTTTFTAYALQQVLKGNLRGYQTAGYTLKPGCGMKGLFTYSKNEPRGKYVGFKG